MVDSHVKEQSWMYPVSEFMQVWQSIDKSYAVIRLFGMLRLLCKALDAAEQSSFIKRINKQRRWMNLESFMLHLSAELQYIKEVLGK